MALATDAAVSRYMTMTREIPSLSREAELELATRWKETGDPDLAEQLIRPHLRFVVAIALKYRRYGLPIAELIGEGNIALVHALNKFEPERGHRFVTYAGYWVRAYILNYVIRSWSMVGGGSGALRSKLFFKLRRERVRVANLVGDGEEAEELLAERFNVSRDQMKKMLQRLESRDVSLDAKRFEDGATALVDTLEAPEDPSEDVLEANEQAQLRAHAVREAIAELDPRERYIVTSRLMAESEDALSLAEIGRNLGVSRERARQLEVRAKGKLRTKLEQLAKTSGGDWLDTAAA